MLNESKLLQGMKVIEEFLDKGDISEVTAETQKLIGPRDGRRTEYESSRDLANQASDVKKRAGLFSEKLTAELNKIGLHSQQEWDAELDNYYISTERVFRKAPKEITGLIIPLVPPGNQVGGKRVPYYACDGTYDFTYVMAREKDEAIFSEYEPIDNYVDSKFCEENDIAITPLQYTSGRNARYFYDKGTVSYNLVFDEEMCAPGHLLRRLNHLLVFKMLADFGIEAHMEGNDVIVNDSQKKIAGCRMLNLTVTNPISGINWNRDANDILAIINMSWDANLAEGALRGEKRPAIEVTSMNDELGRIIDPTDVKDSFLRHVSGIFNTKITEVEWSD